MTKKTKNVPVPKQVALLAEAVQCGNPESARLLVIRAFDVINCKSEFEWNEKVDDAAIDSVIALIHDIKPRDAIELILATQLVSTHFQSLIKLGSGDKSDTTHGMMLMRLSHQALDSLQKYRNKGSNINFNYYVHNEGQAVLQTNIARNLEKKG